MLVSPIRRRAVCVGEEPSDVTAAEVLGNIDAMARAVQSVEESSGTITLDHLLEVHRGKIRTEQNWIGGSDYNPCSAIVVPLPPEMVPSLLNDLITF